eukprot:6449078-Amphidinium_carterae.1
MMRPRLSVPISNPMQDWDSGEKSPLADSVAIDSERASAQSDAPRSPSQRKTKHKPMAKKRAAARSESHPHFPDSPPLATHGDEIEVSVDFPRQFAEQLCGYIELCLRDHEGATQTE